MFHIPYSYEQELKDQVAERLAALERIHRADVLDKARPGARRTLRSHMGRILPRLGIRLEQPSIATKQVGG